MTSEKRNSNGRFAPGHINSEDKRLKHSEFQKGNTNNNKLIKYPKQCQEAYKDYCSWLSQGNSIESWSYISDEMTLSYKTMEKYIREFPDDFPALHKEVALTKSLKVWEERGLAMMLGQVEKCQPAIFQMFMRNKFGWDKEVNVNKSSNETLAEKLIKLIENTPEEK